MGNQDTYWKIDEKTGKPIIAPVPTAEEQTYTSWLDTDLGKAADTARKDVETALNNHGDFNYVNQGWMDQVLSDIKNRKDFSYNLDEDALYQQYKDKYIKQGKLAMADTIGQASAMTGGYGNSYAQSVGNQAYQASLENLNDIVPELYQMAYDKYQNETQDLYNQYGLLLEDYAREYRVHSDEYNKLLTMLNRADSNFYQGATLHNTEQSNANTVAQNNFQNEFSTWEANASNAWTEAQFDEARRQYEDSKVSNVISNSGGKLTVDDEGNIIAAEGAEADISTVPSGIKNTAKEKASKSSASLESYLDGLEKDGTITPEQADALYEEYKPSTADYKDRQWTAGKNGGINWFWGVDNNATVKDQYGDEIRLDDLVDKLVSQGMEKKKAKEYVKKLQDNLDL